MQGKSVESTSPAANEIRQRAFTLHLVSGRGSEKRDTPSNSGTLAIYGKHKGEIEFPAGPLAKWPAFLLEELLPPQVAGGPNSTLLPAPGLSRPQLGVGFGIWALRIWVSGDFGVENLGLAGGVLGDLGFWGFGLWV